jgi:hypothetical protein
MSAIRKRSDLMTPDATATAYLAAWNETDSETRRKLIADAWTPDATYVDPTGAADSPAALDATIGAVQQRFPGFRFSLVSGPDGHGPNVRFTWGLGPEGAEPPIVGTDFIRLRDGRIAEVTGFLDRVPTA